MVRKTHKEIGKEIEELKELKAIVSDQTVKDATVLGLHEIINIQLKVLEENLDEDAIDELCFGEYAVDDDVAEIDQERELYAMEAWEWMEGVSNPVNDSTDSLVERLKKNIVI